MPRSDSARAMTARCRKANTILLAAADKPAEPKRRPSPAWSPPTSSTTSIGRLRRPNAGHADGGDGPARPQPWRRRCWLRSNDSSTWDQTSLIGKIFIAFGALLTMASAARMFMA